MLRFLSLGSLIQDQIAGRDLAIVAIPSGWGVLIVDRPVAASGTGYRWDFRGSQPSYYFSVGLIRLTLGCDQNIKRCLTLKLGCGLNPLRLLD